MQQSKRVGFSGALTLHMAILILWLVTPVGAQAVMTTCPNPGTTHTANFDLTVDCIMDNVTIIGHVRIDNGVLVIKNSSRIRGHIWSKDKVVTITEDSIIRGDVDQRGNGDVNVFTGALVEGDIRERDRGQVLVNGGTVDGDIGESGEEEGVRLLDAIVTRVLNSGGLP